MGSISAPSVSQELADLPCLNVAKIYAKDGLEIQRLLEAGQKYGFFYLDLRTEMSKQFLEDWESTLRFMDGYFHRDISEKMKDARNSDTHGYEPVGTSAGSSENHRDCYESLKMSDDEMAIKAPQLPPTVLKNYDHFKRFQTFCHETCMEILDCMSSALGMDGDASLTLKHRAGRPTLSTLSLFLYPKQEGPSELVGHNKHTDLGTLTFLLCEQWGLQVLRPDTGAWHWVEPRRGHAIINVGDALRFLSGDRLLSAVHRVAPHGGAEYQDHDRYSIVYFLRPENDVTYRNAKGEFVTAKQWHDEKFDVFRLEHEQQEKAPILCGGMERRGNFVGTIKV
ncbi:putative 2OG-Fe(II) oxygenase family oxidoreductase [Lasiodiplodia theobromae]|uniref:2OG-Fe oxygenase n=1 Tax=Lasiodiplodia theobromae TaxID=45133 RepID=UPI0015C3D584|nr:2OG-Fe oxygenase [Lasiodiplodia theobromae]KAF4537770.1 2OG-Fe oxygenase [Lasiodiplodia theobromae]KAF9633019.1 putative 2OG-Fe(II) oxygenase family oxidoreductase [Lasiodiplodia theobromae]